jgi:multiple sugar transport system ATP-binding protein
LELYDHPANLFVASFLGSPSMNFAEGVLVNRTQGSGLALKLADGGEIVLEGAPASATVGAKVTLGVRPEHIETITQTPDVTMQVEVVEPTGAETHLYGKIGGDTWCVTTRQRSKVEPGERVALRLPAAHIHLFDTESGRRLV